MTAVSNYASLFYVGSTSGSSASFTQVAEVINVEPPKISFKNLDARNHASGKYPSKISSGLIEIDNFKATLGYSGSSLDTMYTTAVAGSPIYCKIAFPNGKNWYFDSLVASWGVASADSQNPDIMKVDIEFEPTGTMLIQ